MNLKCQVLYTNNLLLFFKNTLNAQEYMKFKHISLSRFYDCINTEMFVRTKTLL